MTNLIECPLERCRHRRGAVVLLAAVLMAVLFAFVAFAVDASYLALVRSEAQRCADAGALAAAAKLTEQRPAADIVGAHRVAVDIVRKNPVGSKLPALGLNDGNDPSGDVVMGEIRDFGRPNPLLTFDNPAQFNASRVRVRRDEQQNGRVPLFFANIFGISDAAMRAEATAAVITRIQGFRISDSGNPPNVPLLPFTLEKSVWRAMVSSGSGVDVWTWDPDTGAISPGADGFEEAILFPARNGSPGNFGTVNIGISANDTNHLSQQILEGVSRSDLDYHGGELKLSKTGQLMLSGDTGISAGIKDELASIRGQARIIPLYSEVHGNGNNAVYTIVKFVGVRIVDVQLTGQKKHVAIQPAMVRTSGVIPAEDNLSSEYIVSHPWLVK